MFQEFEVLDLTWLGEFDVELNIKVAKVVVAVGWHTLALNLLDDT